MTFGEDLGWGSSVEESKAILDRYIELGGNFIDTANGYTKGHSETIIGDHIAHDREKRDRLVIATKFSTNLYPGDPNGGGSNRKSIIAACEQSLRRLQTDYIDLYWLHNWDKNTPIEETMAALHALVASGKVRYIGVSDTPAWKAAQAQLIAQFRGWPQFIATQIEYSLAERTVEGELVPMAEELGMGVVPWSPISGGRLSGKYTRSNVGQDTSARAQRLADEARQARDAEDRRNDEIRIMVSGLNAADRAEIGALVERQGKERADLLDDHARPHDGGAAFLVHGFADAAP